MCFFIFNHKNTNKLPLCAVYSIFKIWGQISDVCELWICKSVTVLSLLWLIFTKHQISDLNLVFTAFFTILVRVFFVKNKSTLKGENFDVLFFFCKLNGSYKNLILHFKTLKSFFFLFIISLVFARLRKTHVKWSDAL